jgi:hypothetical protein
MDTSLVDKLSSLTPEERIPLIADAFTDRVASALELDPTSIDIEAPFWEIAPVLKDIPMRSRLLITPWVKEYFGFKGFHLYETSLLDSISELARYLAFELEPVAIPTEPLDEQNTYWKWDWSTPAPFQGSTRVQGDTAFLLGAPRSGTSLLRSMLTCHQQVCAPNELHLLNFDDMGQRRNDIERLSQQWMNMGLVEILQDEFGMTVWDSVLKVKQAADKGMPIEHVYEFIHSKMAGRLLIDKSPTYARHPVWLQRAEQMFTNPRYLYLTRHPYAVMDSFMRGRFYRYSAAIWGTSNDNPWHAAELSWTDINRNIQQFLKQVPASRQLWITYEDLMLDTQNTLKAVCEFLSIPYDPKIMDPYSELGDSIASNLQGRSRVEHSNADIWREKRPPHPLGELTRQLADELGYPLT